jgi:hypothetical protein
VRHAVHPAPGWPLPRSPANGPIRFGIVLVKVLLLIGLALLPLPALWLGVRGVGRRSGYSSTDSTDRSTIVVLVTLRVLTMLLVLVLTAVLLVSLIGAMIRDVDLHGMVYVLFVLDLLLATLVLLTFGRRERRRARRRATPARR